MPRFPKKIQNRSMELRRLGFTIKETIQQLNLEFPTEPMPAPRTVASWGAKVGQARVRDYGPEVRTKVVELHQQDFSPESIRTTIRLDLGRDVKLSTILSWISHFQHGKLRADGTYVDTKTPDEKPEKVVQHMPRLKVQQWGGPDERLKIRYGEWKPRGELTPDEKVRLQQAPPKKPSWWPRARACAKEFTLEMVYPSLMTLWVCFLIGVLMVAGTVVAKMIGAL